MPTAEQVATCLRILDGVLGGEAALTPKAEPVLAGVNGEPGGPGGS